MDVLTSWSCEYCLPPYTLYTKREKKKGFALISSVAEFCWTYASRIIHSKLESALDGKEFMLITGYVYLLPVLIGSLRSSVSTAVTHVNSQALLLKKGSFVAPEKVLLNEA